MRVRPRMPVLKMRSEKCGMRNRDARAASLVPHSAFPVPHSVCSQGVSSSARRFAKAEARGASPRESAMFKLGTKNAKRGTKQTRFSDSAFPIPRSAPYSPLCLSSHRSGFVNRHSSVRVRPGAPFRNAERGTQRATLVAPHSALPAPRLNQERGVTAASLPVKETVRVRIPAS